MWNIQLSSTYSGIIFLINFIFAIVGLYFFFKKYKTYNKRVSMRAIFGSLIQKQLFIVLMVEFSVKFSIFYFITDKVSISMFNAAPVAGFFLSAYNL